MLSICLTLSLLVVPPQQEREQPASEALSLGTSLLKWDRSWNNLTLGIVDIDWTEDEDLEGTKGLIAGRYAFDRTRAESPTGTDQLEFVLDTHWQLGDSDPVGERVEIAATYRIEQFHSVLKKPKKVRGVLDQVQWGRLAWSKDDSLEVDYNVDLQVLKLGRFWAYKTSSDSEITTILGLSGSVGWAWSDVNDPTYSDVSNPSLGTWSVLAIEHERFGQLYADSNVLQGFTFGEPKSTTARFAYARFGYRINLSKSWSLDLFGEKRSWHVNAFDIPDLYNKARRVGFELEYRF